MARRLKFHRLPHFCNLYHPVEDDYVHRGKVQREVYNNIDTVHRYARKTSACSSSWSNPSCTDAKWLALTETRFLAEGRSSRNRVTEVEPVEAKILETYHRCRRIAMTTSASIGPRFCSENWIALILRGSSD